MSSRWSSSSSSSILKLSLNSSIPRTFSGDSNGELPERHLSLLFDTTAYRALALDAHTEGLWRFAGGAASWIAAPVGAAPVDAALVAWTEQQRIKSTQLCHLVENADVKYGQVN
jgi:hypothetical protein